MRVGGCGVVRRSWRRGVRRRRGGSCASERKRSIGPIWQSSLAALSGPPPASSSSRGASVWVRACRSRSSSAIERVSVLQRASRSRAIRTKVVCSRPVSRRLSRSSQTARSSAPTAPPSSGRARADASAAVAGSDAARRPGRRGDQPAASTRARSLRRDVARPAQAPAAPPGRPRARRSSRTCPGCGHVGAAAPSAGATLLSGHARRSWSAAATQRWKVRRESTFGNRVSRRATRTLKLQPDSTSPR